VVVVVAFSLILAFGGKENSADSAGLLVILRLWRVSKIINCTTYIFYNIWYTLK